MSYSLLERILRPKIAQSSATRDQVLYCDQLASSLLEVGKGLPLLMLRTIFAKRGESISPLLMHNTWPLHGSQSLRGTNDGLYASAGAFLASSFGGGTELIQIVFPFFVVPCGISNSSEELTPAGRLPLPPWTLLSNLHAPIARALLPRWEERLR